MVVLWSFYSPDFAALSAELATIKAAAPGALHVAGGVHATAEPAQTVDAGWDVAAVGEGESTLLRLVDTGGDPNGVTGLAYRDPTGKLVKKRPSRTTTGQRPAGHDPTYLTRLVQDELAAAQAVIDAHVHSRYGFCATCGNLVPCARRVDASAVFARYHRLPRRRPGLALDGPCR